jgi:hypothetical protein
MARQMANEAFEKRLDDIAMGSNDYKLYQHYLQNISLQTVQLREILREILNRGKERVWLRNQSQGNLDDSKLVDGLSGERMIFKKRGYSERHISADASVLRHDGDEGAPPKKRIQFVMDVSGSMMRFNGYDRRLERMLEASLLIMESLPRSGPPPPGEVAGTVTGSSTDANDAELAELIEYSITGHSGETAQELFVDFPVPESATWSESESGGGEGSEQWSAAVGKGADELLGAMGLRMKKNTRSNKRRARIPDGLLDEKDRMSALEKMVAHTQFCMPGDHTLEATDKAIDRVLYGAEEGDNLHRMVRVLWCVFVCFFEC